MFKNIKLMAAAGLVAAMSLTSCSGSDAAEKKEIGIQAVRGGSIVGEHDVIFAGRDEVVTFSHTAYSKAIFAKGAVQAAKFLAGKGPGLYTMADVIG